MFIKACYAKRALVIRGGRTYRRQIVPGALTDLSNPASAGPERINWQENIHTGEFHNIISPDTVAELEAEFQAVPVKPVTPETHSC